MIRRRTPRATRSVLGGVGAGAVLAMTAPLTPLGASLPDPAGTVEDTVPLRPVGAASVALGTGGPPASGPGVAPAPTGAPPPALDVTDAARAALDGVPTDPGSPARSALDAIGAHRAATMVPAPRAAPESEQAPGRQQLPSIPRKTAEPAPATGLSGALADVVALTNTERAQAGCPALTTDPRITAAAQAHSEDLAANDYFAHDSQDGRDFADRITAAGYDSPGAENIAMGQQDAASVVQDWMDSPGHRRNILNCSLTTIGVGLADGYWTQNFGR
ncbi:CAP domain-containing protein [Pseudonocardia parietis]|uniref:Uncharacterized protein YkwD n=1 Tax=Pseudonocardia parietis TaxID=570936 RepID=A0ABS4W1S9_9PSEU|nr:CAP domain-containing protein [Pseudonocardia parietis]MBP2370120.1 uncharacterized protein YkwD [Pseudonocardia parietis]